MEKQIQGYVNSFPTGGFASVVKALLKGAQVVVPGWGYLSVVSIENRKTVDGKETVEVRKTALFKPARVGDADPFGLKAAISTPLSEGKTVNIPDIGIFRPIVARDGEKRVSFTGSLSLRKELSRAVQNDDTPRSPVLGIAQPETIKPAPQPTIRLSAGIREESAEQKKTVDEIILQPTALIPHTTPIDKVEPAPERKDEYRSTVKPDTVAEGRPVAVHEERKPVMTKKTAKVGDMVVPQVNNDESLEDTMHRRRHSRTYRKIRTVLNILIAVAFAIFIAYITYRMVKPDTATATYERPMRVTVENRTDLTELAEKNYGNRAFWIYIYLANRDKITSPVNIPDGVEVTIPNLAEYGVKLGDGEDIKSAVDRANQLARVIIEEKQ
jgi:nucleoid DNA-binding protein